MKICNHCHGHGYMEREDKDGNVGEIMCPYCGGYGYTGEMNEGDEDADT